MRAVAVPSRVLSSQRAHKQYHTRCATIGTGLAGALHCGISVVVYVVAAAAAVFEKRRVKGRK